MSRPEAEAQFQTEISLLKWTRPVFECAKSFSRGHKETKNSAEASLLFPGTVSTACLQVDAGKHIQAACL